MQNLETLKQLVVIEAKRVIELIENEIDFESNCKPDFNKAELKHKMHELRRDTLKLDSLVNGY